jgi:hypothetical protein
MQSMNDSELNQTLRSARVPEPPADQWDRFPQRVVQRLRREITKPAPRVRPRRALLLWGIGFATACLVIGFGFGFWRGRHVPADDGSLAESSKLIREVATLFPNRVRAIISDRSGVRLVLSDRPDVPVSTPLFVKVCQGTKCQTIITFSGQEIQVANENVEVLADARGNVLLVGDRLVWSSAESTRTVANLKIAAKPLDAVL